MILFIQAAVGVLAIREKPLFENRSDEVGHLNMARFVAEQRRLPGAGDIPDAADPATQQYSQPPAYYVALAPLVALVDDGQPIPGQPNPKVVCDAYNGNVTGWARPREFNPVDSGAVRVGLLMRAVQLALALGTTLVTFRVARRLFPAEPALAVCAAALYAFMPSLVSTTAFIGNDLPVVFIGALALDVATGVRRPLARFSLLLALAGLAALTKSTGWSVFILLLPEFWRVTAGLRSRLRAGLILVAAALLTVTLIVGFNLATTGSLIGRYPLSWLQVRNALDDVARPALADFWGAILQRDVVNSIPVRGVARVLPMSLALIGVGALVLIYRLFRSRRLAQALSLPALLVAASIVLIAARNLTAPSELYVFAPFRYLGPAIPAAAILTAAALWAYPQTVGIRRIVMLAVPLAWLALSILSYTATPIPREESASAVPGWTLPSDATPISDAQTDAPLRVAGYTLAPNDTFDDGLLGLTLYLSPGQAVPDSVDVLELSVGDSPCRFSPAHGLRPTSSFLPGEMVATRLLLPYCDEEMAGLVEVDLRWRKASADGASTAPLDLPPLRLLSVSGTAHRAPDCRPDLGRFAGALQIIKADVPATFRAGGSLLLSVNWWAMDTVPVAYNRVFVARDESGQEIARCQGSPREGNDPTNRWDAGEIIFDDRCRLMMTEARAGATYTVWIGLQDPSDGNYLAHDDDGDPSFVQLGAAVAG